MSVFPQDVRFGMSIGVVAFALVLITSADANGDVEVGLFTESVSISVSGPIDLGGPHGSGASVWAHPSGSAETAPATVTNTGNTEFNRVYVSYAGDLGLEGVCDGGDGHWQAVTSSSPGEDQFRTRVWVSTSTSGNFTGFNNGSATIPPGGVTTNVLAEPVAAAGTTQLMLNINTPSPAVAGGDGCYINLILTAAAEAD